LWTKWQCPSQRFVSTLATVLDLDPMPAALPTMPYLSSANIPDSAMFIDSNEIDRAKAL